MSVAHFVFCYRYFRIKVKWFKGRKQHSYGEEEEIEVGSQELNQVDDLDNSWEPSQDGIISELRILAEVNVLCTSEQGAQWVPLIDSLIPIHATNTQDITTGTSIIHLGADGGEETSLDLLITLSESKLKKCSECFVRWKDVQSGKVWGLNFLSEQEAFEFMTFCEDSHYNVSSGASSQSLNRKSISSLNSSLNQRDLPGKPSSSQYSARQPSGQDASMPQGDTIFNNNRGRRCPGKTECTDSGVGEDEMQDAAQDDFNFTEFSYFREMEIFHSAVNEKYLSKDKARIEVENINRAADTSSGGLRRSGWLSMKHILICGRNGRVEQASHRKWKNYWVILKDNQMNLYQCDEKDMGSLDMNSPSVVVKVDGCLAQAIPEHAKLENVFGLSTKDGDAFYFQGSNLSEVEGWISSIHSTSAVQFVGSRNKDQTRWLLTCKLEKTQESIESDCKLKKMAELQLTVVTESKSKQVITEQISKWERNVEKLSLDLYKLQCYLSAVSGCSPPSPQHVLASASKNTKQNMSRLGVFSVTSFHSLVSCRENTSNVHLGTGAKVKRSKSGAGYGRLKSALMSSLKITDSSTAAKVRELHSPKLSRQEIVEDQRDDISIASDMSDWQQMGNFLRIELPGHGSTVVSMKEDMTFYDVVRAVTNKRQLDPEMYFIMFGVEKQSQIEYYTPQEQSFIEDQNFGVLKLCKKSEYTAQLSKTNEDCDISFGLSLKVENDRMIVSRVLDGSASHLSGILEGDEILSVNSIDIEKADDDIIDLQNALAEPFITLRLRSLREEVPEQIRKATESIISTLVCPPPPRASSTEYLDLAELIVPPPELDDMSSTRGSSARNSCMVEDDGVSVNVLLQSAEEVTTFCRQHDFLREIEKQTELSDAEKLRRIILELVDTEKNYLKDVQTLLKRYLEPLRREKLLPTEEVNSLTENVSQIIDFQSSFCNEIQQLIDCEEDFKNINEVELFQNVIYGIGEAFLQYADKFKLYSSFCVTHSRIIHMLQPGSNNALEEFLNARNPKQQHSSKLESYLIKPIQRVLKYPLLLNGMLKLLAKESDEYKCLSEAVSALENVAEHINEMQNITEKFLPIFQELASVTPGLNVSDVDVDKLLVHKKVTWLNSPDTMKASSLRWSPAPLRKLKNETSVRCFVFPKAVILIQLERRQKKRDKSSKASLKVKEEINFKTLLPISSLTLRDNSWCDKDLFCAWELVDVSSPSGGTEQQETLYLLSSRNADERNETVRAIKDAIRESMLEDSNHLSQRKPSITNILSTTSIHLAFPNEPAHLRSRSFSESRRAKSKSLGRQYSASEVKMFGNKW